MTSQHEDRGEQEPRKPSRRVRLRFLLPAALFALATTGCGLGTLDKTARIQANLGEAQRLEQLGQVDQAHQWTDRAIAIEPTSLYTYVPKDLEITQENPPLTVEDIYGNGTDPAGPNIVDNPSIVLYMRQAEAKFPNAWEPLVPLGSAQKEMGDTAGSRATAAKLAALLEKYVVTPGARIDPGIICTLAQAYCDSGNTTVGFAKYEAAIRAYPNDSLPLNNLAYGYAVANTNLPEAERLANAAIASVPRGPTIDEYATEELAEELADYQDTLGWVYYREGKFSDAVGLLLDAVDGAPRIPEVHYHLAMTYLALKQPDAARAELRHAVLLAVDYAAAQQELDRLKTPDAAPATAPPSAA